MVDVTLLGTSALLPLPERFLSAAFLTCNGRSILFDCGEGTQISIRKHDTNIFSIDVIALTHYHGDHIFGLPGLLQTLHTMGRTAPLYIIGPEDGKEILVPLIGLAGETGYDVIVLETEKQKNRETEEQKNGKTEEPNNNDIILLHNINNMWPERAELRLFKTEHRVPSVGYSFTLGRAGKFQKEKAEALDIPVNLWSELQNGNTVSFHDNIFTPDQVLGEPRKGIKVVFSGDTSYCDALTKHSEGADLLISDATYSDNRELAFSRGHMSYYEAAETAENAHVKELWLTHFSQTITDPTINLSIATDIFPNSVIGFDGMNKTINFI